MVDRYTYYLLHGEQLHVLVLGNGHLQVVYETLSKQLYKTHIWAAYMGREGVKWARDLVSVLKVGWCGLQAAHTIQPLRQTRDLVPTLPLPFPYKQPIYVFCITAY